MTEGARKSCHRIAAVAAAGLAVFSLGCVTNDGLIVILQNQQPVPDTTTHTCTAPSMTGTAPVGNGTLDLEVGTAPGYFVYPLLQSTLPPRATSPGTVEPNTVYIDSMRVTIHPPPGLNVTWPAGCPATFNWPTTAALLPGTTLGLSAQVVLPCHAQVIHDLFASADLPSEFTQQVLFVVEMRAMGRLTSGSDITSDAFRFSVRMCIGCLQTGFPDIAQYNYPARPSCGAAPKPNGYHGNPCNLAQDYGPVLCCTGDMNQIVCPAPDM
jgi:hypothetical protein